MLDLWLINFLKFYTALSYCFYVLEFNLKIMNINYNSYRIFIIKLHVNIYTCIYTLEKEMATHSSILAWEIPWTEEPTGYSPWDRKKSDMT